MRPMCSSMCIKIFFFIICFYSLKLSAEEMEQGGIAVRLLREGGHIECVDDVKSFEGLLAIGSDQAGYGIFGGKPHENLVDISVNSFFEKDQMHSTLIVEPTPAGCNLFGQRILIMRDSCEESLKKRAQFRGVTTFIDQSGVFVVRNTKNINRGFMIQEGEVCAYAEVLNKVKVENISSGELSDEDFCARAVKNFKASVINRGTDYPALSKSKYSHAGLMTQKNKYGSEIIFYASTLNSKAKCEIASKRIQLFPRDCRTQKRVISELNALKIKTQSNGIGILLDAPNNMEIEMIDIAPNKCLVAISKIDFELLER